RRSPRAGSSARPPEAARVCRLATAALARLHLAHLVDGVARDLHRERLVRHLRLARKARGELEAPRLVEQVVFLLGCRLERVETLAHDHVARGARTALLAGVLDLDAMVEERVADRAARRGLDLLALRAERLVRQHREPG